MIKRLLSIAVVLATSFASEGASSFVENLVAGHPQKIVCYGTSLTAVSHEWVDGLRGELDRRWPGLATVVNAGLSGKNSATGLANVQAKVVAEHPDAVLIEFSMNDAADSLNTGKTPAQALAAAEANLRAIAKAVTDANPNAEIILETMNPHVRVEGSNLSNRTDLDKHVEMYRRVAAEKGWLLIDNYRFWRRIAEDSPGQFLRLVPDGVHPNEAGCRRVTLPNVLRTLGIDEVESARDIPVLADVDVLVVGGTFAGTAAAVAAKESGASVLLLAPRRNLAEDVVLPRRLTIPEGDEPLTDKATAALRPHPRAAQPRAAQLAYTADATPNASKPDTGGKKLVDGKFGSAATQSVQYDGETVTWNLSVVGDEPVVSVILYYYYRPSGGDFDVASIALEASDGGAFAALGGKVTSAVHATGLEYGDECRTLSFDLDVPSSARSFRLTARRADGCRRMLIGEIRAGRGAASAVPLAPLAYEKALDARLDGAGVPFLAGTTACDILKDSQGRVSGAIVANASGRQAVRAKVVVDATVSGVLARRACGLRPVQGEVQTPFSMTVVAKSGLSFGLAGYKVTEGPAVVQTVKLDTHNDASMIPGNAEREYPASTYTFTRPFPLRSGEWQEVAAIVQKMKTDVWTASVADESEVPFYVTPDRIFGAAQISAWTDSASVPLGVFVPQGVSGYYALGQAADIDRALAERLSWPGVASALGARVGAAAAAEAKSRGEIAALVAGNAANGVSTVEVREHLARPLGQSFAGEGSVPSQGGELPVLAVADIAVVGLGTAGSPAAIAALGKGKSVVGIEFLHTPGGVMTEGRIGKYYKGCDRGFTKKIVDPGTLSTGWVFSMAKAEWMRRTVATNALAEVFFGSLAEGVLTEAEDASGRRRVRGLVVVLPDGTRGVVRADVVIDASGNAEVAYRAGVRTQFLDGREFAMQGSGTAYHMLGNSYFNTDFGFLNTSDAGDLSNFARRARAGAGAARYNVGDPSVSSRERRRIVGDVVVTDRDILRRRKWSDTIMHGKSDYDMHGYSVTDTLMYRERPHGTEFKAELPYRALIPADLEGVLATGLGISAQREAMPIIRMQRDVQNQGHAAGLAAAAALATGSVRTIDVRALQRELVAVGSLDSSVLSDEDETVSDSALAAAVQNIAADTFSGMEKILERPAAAKPLLRSAYASAPDDAHRLACAIALVLVGDNSRLSDVIAATETADWSKGFDFRGLGNYGRQTAPVDYLVYTLARSGDSAAVTPVLKTLMAKLVASDGSSAKLSHFRMMTQAAEALASRELCDALAAAVARGNAVSGWAVEDVSKVPAHDANGKDNKTDDLERTRSLIELSVARTLFRAGNDDGRRMLESYLGDPRTIYASYASLALELTPLSPPKEKPLSEFLDCGLLTEGYFNNQVWTGSATYLLTMWSLSAGHTAGSTFP